MRKAIFMLLLAILSSNAMAGWVKVDTIEIGTIYVDPTTIRNTDNKVQMWDLLDLNTTGSIKTKYEYDCKKDQSRLLAVYMYDGKMGGGLTTRTVVHTGKWGPVSPESAAEAKWKIAYGKQGGVQ